MGPNFPQWTSAVHLTYDFFLSVHLQSHSFGCWLRIFRHLAGICVSPFMFVRVLLQFVYKGTVLQKPRRGAGQAEGAHVTAA